MSAQTERIRAAAAALRERGVTGADAAIVLGSGLGAFADALLAGAVGQGKNDFKIPLARKGIVRALKQAAEATPQSQTDKRIA